MEKTPQNKQDWTEQLPDISTRQNVYYDSAHRGYEGLSHEEFMAATARNERADDSERSYGLLITEEQKANWLNTLDKDDKAVINHHVKGIFDNHPGSASEATDEVERYIATLVAQDIHDNPDDEDYAYIKKPEPPVREDREPAVYGFSARDLHNRGIDLPFDVPKGGYEPSSHVDANGKSTELELWRDQTSSEPEAAPKEASENSLFDWDEKAPELRLTDEERRQLYPDEETPDNTEVIPEVEEPTAVMPVVEGDYHAVPTGSFLERLREIKADRRERLSSADAELMATRKAYAAELAAARKGGNVPRSRLTKEQKIARLEEEIAGIDRRLAILDREDAAKAELAELRFDKLGKLGRVGRKLGSLAFNNTVAPRLALKGEYAGSSQVLTAEEQAIKGADLNADIARINAINRKAAQRKGKPFIALPVDTPVLPLPQAAAPVAPANRPAHPDRDEGTPSFYEGLKLQASPALEKLKGLNIAKLRRLGGLAATKAEMGLIDIGLADKYYDSRIRKLLFDADAAEKATYSTSGITPEQVDYMLDRALKLRRQAAELEARRDDQVARRSALSS